MSTTLDTATLIPGRTIEVDGSGAVTAVTQKYQVVRAFATPLNAENLSTITGLPVMRAAHPTYSGLLVSGYKLSEDATGVRWVVDVDYTLFSRSTSRNQKPPRGQAEQSRGWGYQDVSKDLTHDAKTGKPVLNSAGDPFESVPQVSIALPVFKRVVKSTAAPATIIYNSGTYNSADVVIDGMTFVKHACRLTISVEKLYRDPDNYLYQYTQEVCVMRNLVKTEPSGTAIDIGWDKAVVQCGFRCKDDEGNIRVIQGVDTLTGGDISLTTPALLDELGRVVEDDWGRIKIIETMKEGDWSATAFT